MNGLPVWAWPVALPLLVPLGPVVGFAVGAHADVGYAQNLSYGQDRNPPFNAVFDPLGQEWGRLPPEPPHNPGLPTQPTTKSSDG